MKKNKNSIIKNLMMQVAKQRGIVAKLCIVCTLLFTVLGCGKQEIDYEEKQLTSSNGEPSAYFYNHENKKVDLWVNTEFAFLSVKEPQLPVNIAQRVIKASEFKADNSDKKQYQGKQGVCRYYAELSFEVGLTEKEYLDLLTDIKLQNGDVIIAPYFKMAKDDKVGLSNFFYVKLKEAKEVKLLEQMAEQTGSIIIEQDAFMPLWFTLSVTEASKLNALECANFFHESGLFQAGEADLMPDSLIETWLQ